MSRILTPKDVAAEDHENSRRARASAVAALVACSYGDPNSDARFRPMDAKGWIYVVGFDKYVKIGFSSRPKYRIADLQSGLPVPIVVHVVFAGTKISEKEIQARFKEFHLRGEWFLLKGRLREFVNYRKKSQAKRSSGDDWRRE